MILILLAFVRYFFLWAYRCFFFLCVHFFSRWKEKRWNSLFVALLFCLFCADLLLQVE